MSAKDDLIHGQNIWDEDRRKMKAEMARLYASKEALYAAKDAVQEELRECSAAKIVAENLVQERMRELGMTHARGIIEYAELQY